MAKSESKTYDPASVEKQIFETWEKGGYFRAEPDGREERFCVVIPPPNVTGALHLGHALNNTLQDILIRRERMRGKNTFWLVGTDHAGIATQATVEKTIREKEGKSRHDLGRDELVRRIWEWKEKFGGRIVEQLRLMGCSCDYSRERFTLDDMCAKAVRHTFFKLFRDGLIYRGKRLVNWDTQLQTAVADDEVYHETVKGHFYHFKYPVKNPQPGEPEHLHIATTRPETMLADTAVAVHPEPDAALDKVEAELKEKLSTSADKEKPGIEAAIEDLGERRKSLLPTLLKLRDMAKAGRMMILPLVDREIPLICDTWAKPELGSGCVKITPAHDPNDYEVGQRHDLPMINVLTEDGKVAEIIELDGSVNPNSSKYAGLKFNTAGRKKVVEDLEAAGLVERIEDRLIDLGHSDRSKMPIEPFLSDQWFVRMSDLKREHAAQIEGLRHHASGLAQMAVDAVKRGDVRFHPARYEKTYVDWLSEKRDWCISRQLWWGHRIPVWSRVMKLSDLCAQTGRGEEALEHLFEITPCDAVIRVEEVGGNRHWHDIDRNPPSTIGWQELRAALQEGDCEVRVLICPAPNLEHKGLEPNEAIADRVQRYAEEAGFIQDSDVLDTWFSSALWPHSTLGWPDAEAPIRAATVRERSPHDTEQTDKSGRQPLPDGRGSDSPDGTDSLLGYYYPTSVLSTAREIITLWVARMVMTGLYNIGDVPFSDVVIHPVIQDGQGRKMSKTLGNGVDPVDIIHKYGADALRFTLADLATETQDIRMPVQKEKLPDGREINISPKFEKGRNFCNKLWQASTGFVIRGLDGYAPTELDPQTLRLEDRWILSRMTTCLLELEQALSRYRFSESMNVLYQFMWNEYCDWYIEMSKSRLAGPERGPAQQVLAYVLDQLLRVLHPFIPFVTEAIWTELNTAAPNRGCANLEKGEPALVNAKWPSVDASLRDDAVESQMAELQAIIKAVREIRTIVNGHRGKEKQPTMRTLPLAVVMGDRDTSKLVETHREFIQSLAGCDLLEARSKEAKPAGALGRVVGSTGVYVPVADLIDLKQVRQDEEKKLEELQKALGRTEKQLGNEDFVQRAAPTVVEQARQRAADLAGQIETLEQHLADLT
ncbi:MAG: valine--tRNA ligase [Phycisphaerales bacterium]|nr:valine--tRNA ligase [Phycisphaerales bacterium]